MDEIKETKLETTSAPSKRASEIMGKQQKSFGGMNLFGPKVSKSPLEKSESKIDTLSEVKKSGISMDAPDYDPKSLSEQGRKFYENQEENFDDVGLIHDVPGMIETYHKYGLDSNKFINKMTDNKIARLAVEDMFPKIFAPLYEEGRLDESGKVSPEAYGWALRQGFKEIYNNPQKAKEFQSKMRFKAADEKAKLFELMSKGSK